MYSYTRIIELVENDKLSIKDGCKIIAAIDLPDDKHPMLKIISGAAYHIAFIDESDKAIEADWSQIVKVHKDYREDKRYSTYYALSLIYAERAETDNITKSYGAFIKRRNGETTIETGSKKIKKKLSLQKDKVNENQTDRRYLEQFQLFAPKKIDNLELQNHGLSEHADQDD